MHRNADMTSKNKVTRYLASMNKFNQENSQDGNPLVGISENGSSNSDGGKDSNNNEQMSNNSKLANLNSEIDIKNVSESNQNNASGSSGGGTDNSSNQVPFVPIIFLACPNILKNEHCQCGH